MHAFLETERVQSHKPVVVVRGADQFSADSLSYDNLNRLVELKGRVKGVLSGTRSGSGSSDNPRP